MPWNNRDVFTNKGGSKKKQDEFYGIIPSDLDNFIHSTTPEQEKEYIMNVLDIELDNGDL